MTNTISFFNYLILFSDFPEPGDQDLSKGVEFINKNDLRKALYHFEKAHNYDNEYATIFVALFNFVGFGTDKRDPNKSLTLLKKAATEWNNRVAQYFMGAMYFEGDENFDQDHETAIKWITLSANNGWIQAMAHLAQYYYTVDKTNQDLNKAVYWCKKVTESEEKDIAYLFGNEAFEIVMKKQISEVFATEKDNEIQEPQFNLTEKEALCEVYQVLFWVLMTNKKSNSERVCQLLLGSIYRDGGTNFSANLEESLLWFKKAEDNKKSGASLELESFSDNDIYSKKNYEEVMKWYMRSKKFGRIYLLCNGTVYNFGTTLAYLDAVRDQTEVSEIYSMMGSLYESGGNRIKQDYSKAIEFYSKAVDNGCSKASIRMGSFFLYGQVIKKDETQAYDWFSKGASMGSAQANYMLGNMHYEGYKGKVDLDKALEYYEKSNEAGFLPAENKIEEVMMMKLMIGMVRSTPKRVKRVRN